VQSPDPRLLSPLGGVALAPQPVGPRAAVRPQSTGCQVHPVLSMPVSWVLPVIVGASDTGSAPGETAIDGVNAQMRRQPSSCVGGFDSECDHEPLVGLVRRGLCALADGAWTIQWLPSRLISLVK